MIKSLTALAIFGLLGAAVAALPGFAPQVAAGETVALAKANKAASLCCSLQRVGVNRRGFPTPIGTLSY